MMFLAILLSIVSLSNTQTVTNSWSYTGKKDGPTTWGGVCNTGVKQSPIDLTGGTPTGYSDWKFNNFYLNGQMKIENNGHTAKASFTDGTKPTVSGGGLANVYEALQFHFHWGADSSKGSEHTVNGRMAPLELHIVNMNTAAGVPAQEMFTVLGVMYRVQLFDNPALTPIIDALSRIKVSGTSTDLTTKINLQQLLPQGLNQFWRYEGSLTTPTCNEVVIWTVFKETVGISERQLQAFRQLTWVDAADTGSTLPLVDTFRAVQPLNSRILYDGYCESSTPFVVVRFGLSNLADIVNRLGLAAFLLAIAAVLFGLSF